MSVKTIKGTEILDSVAISATSLNDNPTAIDPATGETRKSEPYWRTTIAFKDGKRTGILRADAVQAIKDGNCASLTIEETELDIMDPETGEPSGEKRPTFTYVNHSTYTQVKNIKRNERELTEIENGTTVNDEFIANLAAKIKAAQEQPAVVE